MSAMDDRLRLAEREEQERIARPYGYTRQRLDANTRAVNRLREAHNEHVTWTQTLRDETRAVFTTIRDQSAYRADRNYWALSERIEQLTLILVHAGLVPWTALHELLDDSATDQYGAIPGCRCGSCPPDHLDPCSCRECRAAADAAERNSPEGIARRQLVREFMESEA